MEAAQTFTLTRNKTLASWLWILVGLNATPSLLSLSGSRRIPFAFGFRSAQR